MGVWFKWNVTDSCEVKYDFRFAVHLCFSLFHRVSLSPQGASPAPASPVLPSPRDSRQSLTEECDAVKCFANRTCVRRMHTYKVRRGAGGRICHPSNEDARVPPRAVTLTSPPRAALDTTAQGPSEPHDLTTSPGFYTTVPQRK